MLSPGSSLLIFGIGCLQEVGSQWALPPTQVSMTAAARDDPHLLFCDTWSEVQEVSVKKPRGYRIEPQPPTLTLLATKVVLGLCIFPSLLTLILQTLHWSVPALGGSLGTGGWLRHGQPRV